MLQTPYAHALQLFVYSDASIETVSDISALIADLRGQGLTYRRISQIFECAPQQVRKMQRDGGSALVRDAGACDSWGLVERRIYFNAKSGHYRVRLHGKKIRCGTLTQARQIRDDAQEHP